MNQLEFLLEAAVREHLPSREKQEEIRASIRCKRPSPGYYSACQRTDEIFQKAFSSFRQFQRLGDTNTALWSGLKEGQHSPPR